MRKTLTPSTEDVDDDGRDKREERGEREERERGKNCNRTDEEVEHEETIGKP